MFKCNKYFNIFEMITWHAIYFPRGILVALLPMKSITLNLTSNTNCSFHLKIGMTDSFYFFALSDMSIFTTDSSGDLEGIEFDIPEWEAVSEPPDGPVRGPSILRKQFPQAQAPGSMKDKNIQTSESIKHAIRISLSCFLSAFLL